MRIDTSDLRVRWQDKDNEGTDLPQLCQIFSAAFPLETWTAADFIRFRKKEDANNVIKVLTQHPADGDLIYGGLMYTVTPELVRIRRIVIAEPFRLHGFGRYLMSFLIGHRSGIRRRKFLATLSEYDETSQLFFRALGFRVSKTGGIKKVEGKPDRYQFTFLKQTEPARLVCTS